MGALGGLGGLGGLGAIAGGFLPTDIGNLTVWLKASHITSKNDGDTITTWSDQSSNGNDLTQATASKKPTYQTNELNGKPIVRFDGSDDVLAVTYGANLDQPNTIFVVAKFVGLGTGTHRFLLDGVGSVRNAIYRRPETSPNWWFYAGTEKDSGDSVDTSYHTLIAVFNGASSTLRQDGVEILADNPGTWSMGGLTLAADPAETGPGQVDIAEVAIYDADVGAAGYAQLESYATSEYGI